MEVTYVCSDENSDIHLVNVDTKSLPCMLCTPSKTERFANMRHLLGHFTNDHSAIHLYGCHLCNQAMPSYTDFMMHKCFEDRDEEFVLNEPRFSFCHALLICADCGIQFNLNNGVVNEKATREYLSLMAVHNSSAMTLVCIYSIGSIKKDHFYVNYNGEMAKSDLLCKNDTELSNCCPTLFPKYYNSESLALATFARTAQQSECLELINVKPKIKSVSIDDALSEVMRTEKTICINAFNCNMEKMIDLEPGFFKTLHSVDENNACIGQAENQIKLYVSSYESCIPHDILKGFLFNKDVYECAGCRALYDKLESLEEHYEGCRTKNKNQLPTKFDLFNTECARMVFNSGLHPSFRVLCGECSDLSFCSFIGLRLHYAQEHSIFVNDNHFGISNKQGIDDYGWRVVSKCIRDEASSALKQIVPSNVETLIKSDSINPVKKQGGQRGRRPLNEKKDEDLNLKRASFTRFLHKRPNVINPLEEALSLNASTGERSMTPASFTSDVRQFATNEFDSRRDLRSTSRSKRSHVSHSPTGDDHNSSFGSTENNSNRKRPVSERAKKMEQKKLERERREIEDAEKEEHDKDRRRRRAKQVENSYSEIDRFEPNYSSMNREEHSNLKNRSQRAQEDVRVEVVTLSDDEFDDRESRGVSEPRSNHSSHIANDGYCFSCFFCGESIFDATEFVQHLGRHNEHIQRCPICITTERKEHQLKHILHVIDHIVESHIRTEDNHCVCPTCHKDFGLIQDIQPLYMCFQHVLFSCEESKYCMLCLARNECIPQRLREKFWNHCNEEHSVVYNRFICSKCMSGFPSKFALLDHTCSYTHRCVCSIGRPFINKQMFLEHVQDSNDGIKHMPIKQMSEEVGIYCPSSRRKELRQMELEGLNKRYIKHPTRDECILFFQKYPHLHHPFSSQMSNQFKNLRVIQDLPSMSKEFNRVRAISSIPPQLNHSRPIHSISASSKPINALSSEDLRSLLTKKLEAHRNGNIEKPQMKRRRRKRLNQEGNPENPKKFKFVKDPPVFRSSVWKYVEKYGEEYKEVADVVEDLVLSVSDISTVFANGLDKIGRSSRQTKKTLYNIPQPKVQQLPKLIPISTNVSTNNNTIEENDSDDGIEIIGEVKRQVDPSPPIPQQQPRRIFIYRQAQNRVINVNPDSQYYAPQRSFAPNVYANQNQVLPNGEDGNWINQPYTH